MKFNGKLLFQSRYIFHVLYLTVYSWFLILDKRWYSTQDDWKTYFPTFVVHILLMIFLVGVNIFVLIPLLYFRKKVLLYSLSLIFIIAVYTIGKATYDRYAIMHIFNLAGSAWGQYLWDAFVFAIWFTIIASMLYIVQNWQDNQQQVKNSKIDQLQTELKYLRAQINPHFFFNGLNTVYGFIDSDNQQARDVLLQFSDLLRYNLYEADVDQVDLDKEAAYLENYVALQRARSSRTLKITLQINIDDKHIKIAPLLFIPFVENAFKFSSREVGRENIIKISLQQKGRELNFRCTNSYEPEEEKAGGGIGLTNVKRRLELLYKDNYTLNILDDNKFWFVKLTIEL